MHLSSALPVKFFLLNGPIYSSEVVSLSSLCIHPGKAVWVLYVDATCINYNGNAFDAALMAMVAALKNSASFPKIYCGTSPDLHISSTAKGNV